MRAKVLWSLVGATIAAVALVSASGAATTKTQKVTRLDVSTRAAVVHYLRSIHVNPKGALIQRGTLNYAGARCPGKAWMCASTHHTVVQIARRGGQNRFVCRSARCVVVQLAGASHGTFITGRHLASTTAASKGNTATCIKTTGLTQSCSINQSGAGPNTAIVYENAGKLSGLTQTALYSAAITQTATGATSGNTACVTQNVNIDGSTNAAKGKPVTVTLEAHQSVTIKQDVLGSGANTAVNGATSAGSCDTATLGQSQTLTSIANGSGAITQNENDANIACPDGRATPDYFNLCLDIEQNQGSGHGVASGSNKATFVQTNSLTAVANTSVGPVTQTQSSATGGLVGTVNQDSSGLSTTSATQQETQCEDAAKSGLTGCDVSDPDAFEAPSGLTQTQYGPEGVGKARTSHRGRILYGMQKGLGTATQTGNNNDQFTVSQTSTQNNDQGSGSHQTNTVQGDCSTSGNCNITQNTTVDGQQTTNTQSGQNVNTSTTCTGSNCQKSVPADPTIDTKPPNPSYSTSATFTFSDTTSPVTFLCSLDGGAYAACISPKTYTGLTNSSHTFSVEAKDSNGNVSDHAASYTWTIAPPPTPTITSNPSNPSNSSGASFAFADSDSTATFECQIDNSGYSGCSSPWTYGNLADGSHTFYVKADDQTGQSAPATLTWTISGGGASANTVDQLNPTSDPAGGDCADGYASGTGFQGTPQQVTDIADLSQFDGQAIQLRFSFSTGDANYNAFEGWYVKNIQVTGTQSGNPVTVFSDAVAAGDTSFTASNDFGVTPGWHVTDRFGAPAWWYGNETTGTYQSPNSTIGSCTDSSANSGTITTPVFTLAMGSQLTFDTLWQIESVNPATFDLMDVQVIPVSSGPPIF
jgi:hypothetical protein